MRRFFTAETGFFLVVWLLLIVTGRNSLLRDPGTPWHIVVGQRIVAGEGIPHCDSFSFTRAGADWTAHQWAAESLMALVYNFGGWDALVLATAAFLAAIYAWLAGRLIRGGLGLMPTGCLLAIILMASSHQFHARPLIFTIALLGLTFALLVDVESGRRSPRWLWVLPPLIVVWANLHGGVLAGIGTIGLCLGGWCALWLLRKDSPVKSFRGVLNVSAVVVCCCAAVLVNPYGLDLPWAWFNTLAIQLPELIKEHAPLDPSSPIAVAFIMLAVAYAVVLVGTFGKKTRVVWWLPAVWAVFAVERVRNVPLFAVTATIALADMLAYSRLSGWLAAKDMFSAPDDEQPKAFPWPATILPAILLAFALFVLPIFYRGWAGPDAKSFPVALLPELEKMAEENPDGTPIFNDMNFGGFLIQQTPRLRVFIDDRCALYGAEMLVDYELARLAEPAQLDVWRQQYGFRHALVATGDAFDKYLADSEDWREVKKTPVAVLYEVTPE